MTVTNHGLSALTHAPADKRLQWPFKDGKTYPISTSFNDATSGAKYPQKSGHEGIDVASLSRPGLFPSLSIQGSAPSARGCRSARAAPAAGSWEMKQRGLRWSLAPPSSSSLRPGSADHARP